MRSPDGFTEFAPDGASEERFSKGPLTDGGWRPSHPPEKQRERTWKGGWEDIMGERSLRCEPLLSPPGLPPGPSMAELHQKTDQQSRGRSGQGQPSGHRAGQEGTL